MSDKKQIDRLFQEKFKNFEVTPDDAVWENINSRLHKDKRKRRVIPIWWKLGGVAAALFLMLTVGNVLYNEFSSSGSSNIAPVVNTDTTNFEGTNNIKGSTNSATDNTTIANEDDTNSAFENTNSDGAVNPSSNATVDNQNINNPSSSSRSKRNNVAHSDTKSSINSTHKNNQTTTNFTQNAVVTNASSNLPKHSLTPSDTSKENPFTEYLKTAQDNAVTDVNTKEDVSVLDKKEDEKTNKKTIEEAIAEANDDKEKEEDEKLNRWSVTPNVAPVYFNTFGKGSSLDEQFVDNAKSGDLNMSYGVGGSYAVNKKLKIRAGINKVDLGYSTHNVISYQNIDSTGVGARSHLKNVKLSANAQNTTFLSTQTFNRSSTPEIINSKTQGSLDQQLGFIEVPLELEYALLNKKFGVNVIGGFSTLIVDTNEIYSVVDGNKTLVGEANNVNNVSYSANLGLGLNYKISDNIKLNLEPTFKYQIKTFSNSSGDFQPYFIGVYTGLRFKF